MWVFWVLCVPCCLLRLPVIPSLPIVLCIPSPICSLLLSFLPDHSMNPLDPLSKNSLAEHPELNCIRSNLRSKVGIFDAYSAGRLLPTRTMVLDRREKYTRTEYAKAYDAGGFSHKM